jgi:hypothetical protein
MITIRQGLSPNPVKIVKALVTIPYAFVKGMVPDLGLIRDIPPMVRGQPTWGREHQVLNAILAKVDTVKSQDKVVAAVINSGDLVYDGRNPAHWERALRIIQPLSSRVPYFPVAGKPVSRLTVDGIANWQMQCGLPRRRPPVLLLRLRRCVSQADSIPSPCRAYWSHITRWE